MPGQGRRLRTEGAWQLPKIIWSCQHCGTVLALWQVKCFNCHRAALSWLHLVFGVAVVIPALFLLLKLI